MRCDRLDSLLFSRAHLVHWDDGLLTRGSRSYVMRGGGSLPPKPKQCDKFRTSGTGNSAGKQKIIIEKQNNSVFYASTAQPNSFYGMLFVGGIQDIQCPLYCPFHVWLRRVVQKVFHMWWSFKPFVGHPHNVFFSPTKDQSVEEHEVGFRHPRTDQVISDNQLSIPSQNTHDVRSAWALINHNVHRASNCEFDQSHMMFKTT